MAAEVTKFSVYDPRVIQTKPKYAVEKGALSVTNVSFNAQTANSASQQFNVVVPSENVFIDRAVDWVSSGVATITFQMSGTGVTSGGVILTPGEVALAAFPSHQCVNQMTATINDASVSVNTSDVLNYVLRLQDYKKNRLQRTCPTMLDNYASYPAAATKGGVNTAASQSAYFQNSPLATYGGAHAVDEAPNGAFSQWWFCNAAGAPLTTNNGLPVGTGTTSGTFGGSAATETVHIRWQSTEKLFLPPFIFADDAEYSTGLFGVQNFQVQMNMLPTPSRAIRLADSIVGKDIETGKVITAYSIAWASAVTGSYSPYPVQPALSVQFLTPALDVPLPPKSIVPYMEFPRYITNLTPTAVTTLGKVVTSNGTRDGATQVSSNTITLPNIPDLLMIYVKPSSPGAKISDGALYTGQGTGTASPVNTIGVWDSSMADFSLPISGISINFDNFSGLLANHTAYELYKMSVNNGLEMDYATWCGESRRQPASGTGTPYIALCGGPLILKPGRDFALQAGQAPGLVGNFSLQFNLTIGNQYASTINSISLYVVPISSGFFETIKGSSRIIKGVLTEQDILSAPASADHAGRMVGGAFDLNKMVKNISHASGKGGPMNGYM